MAHVTKNRNMFLRCGYIEDRPDAVVLWLYGTDTVFAYMRDKPTEKQLRSVRRDLIRSKAIQTYANGME